MIIMLILFEAFYTIISSGRHDIFLAIFQDAVAYLVNFFCQLGEFSGQKLVGRKSDKTVNKNTNNDKATRRLLISGCFSRLFTLISISCRYSGAKYDGKCKLIKKTIFKFSFITSFLYNFVRAYGYFVQI